MQPWEEYRAYDSTLAELYYGTAQSIYADRIEAALEKLRNLADGFHHDDLRMQLWAHFNNRERANLQTITAKWIKEHQ